MKIFLTGQKQIGKSTCIQECIRECHKSVCGFLTLPFYEEQRRAGFYLHALHAMEHNDQRFSMQHETWNEVIPGVFNSFGTQLLKQARKLQEHILILDEIGRGTSTFDGLSIAWAVVEHISNTRLLGAKTLFATHYHELTELEGLMSGVNNYCIAVKEQGDDIVFLRKIVKGGADKSYGIQVAKLAGVPDTVINRAKELVEQLVDTDLTARTREIAGANASASSHKPVPRPDDVEMSQLTLFDTVREDDIIREIKDMELGNMTPIDALNTLYRLQTKLKNRWSGEEG